MLILASNSPRRRELLTFLGVPFVVHSSNVDETPLPAEHPTAYVERLARRKAEQAVEQWKGEAFFLAADTTVAVENDLGRWEIFGKPVDAHDAERMLRSLRGRTHFVFTGLALLHNPSGVLWSDVCVSEVTLRNFSDEELYAYIASGDPFDKAGAYAIQNVSF
ncbi:MAG: Maf family protein, partial [Anaerolineales bacterium]|nr:Maf family protein [Anaerolineales bacterium]